MRNSREIISLVLISLFFGFVACNSNPKKTATSASEDIEFKKTPSMQGEGVSTLVTDSGLLTYRMEAPKLTINDKVDTPFWHMPEGLHMITYSKDSEPEGDIKSKFALYYIDSDLWELRKEVVAISPEGMKLETELLYWDRKKKEIYTDQFVRITEEGSVTTGYGFKSDEEFVDWVIYEISTEIDVEE